MSARGWDPHKFSSLIRSVVDAAAVAMFDNTDRVIHERVGEPDLRHALGALWALPAGQPIPRAAWEDPRLHHTIDVGDWLVVDRIGEAERVLVVVVGHGPIPTGDVAVALDLVLSGSQERRDLLDEVEEMGDVLRAQGDAALLASISRAQADFILSGDSRSVFSGLLDDVLALTGSEYGFIGEIEHGPDGPFLRTRAITNIAWTDELREWFEQNDPAGLEFTNLDTLFGSVIRTGRPVVANDPGTDSRRGGLPEGHPRLDAFLGLPFVRGSELIGMVGLANRRGGYDQQLIERLHPFLTTCSTLIEGVRGVRERAVTQGRLRLTEARARAILEAVGDAVIVTDADGEIKTFNRAAEQTFGFPAADAVGRRASMLLADPTEHELLVTPSGRCDVTGRHRSGTTVPLELTVHELPVGRERLFVGTYRDLTAEQAADSKIRMYAATIEATPDFVGVARADGRILLVNKAGRELVGLPSEGPVPELAVGAIHAPWSSELVRNVGMPAAIRDGVWAGETAFIAADGREVPMSQVIVVSRDDCGEAQLISTIARDISESKEVERVKSEFVATVSHELRTPLTSIRGSLGLLGGGALGQLPGQAVEIVDMAQRNLERLIRLVNDILDFEKAQAGRLELRLDVVSPLDVASSAIDAVRGLALDAGVELEVVAPVGDDGLVIHGDEDRLVQALVNLLGNAVKFSERGTRVTLTVAALGRSEVDFVVVDRGAGIPDDQLQTIFEPFHQADSSDRRAVGGTGLGLAITEAISRAHGGEITVESTLGVGSVFTLRVPARPAPNGPLRSGVSRGQAGDGVGGRVPAR